MIRGASLTFIAGLFAALLIGANGASGESHDGVGPLEPTTCRLADGLDELRRALRDGSPAYQRYALAWLVESHNLSLRELRAAFAAERDPAVIEALGAAIAARVARKGGEGSLAPVLARAASDRDPAARAAAIRGLRGVGAVEVMARDGALGYAELIRDPAPEVRAAVAENLLHEGSRVYFGHERAVAEESVEAALLVDDPALAARLLRETSMEQLSPSTAARLVDALRGADAVLRGGLVTALGDVPAHSAAASEAALIELYRDVDDPALRRDLLAALVRLRLSAAPPLLESLRDVDPALAPEIDAWLAVLRLGLQEWSLLRREKARTGDDARGQATEQ